MSIASQLIPRVCRAHKPRRILVGPAQFVELACELSLTFSRPDAVLHFMGVPVVLDMPHEFCPSCGAPTEPNVCSYCRTESTTISIEEAA